MMSCPNRDEDRVRRSKRIQIRRTIILPHSACTDTQFSHPSDHSPANAPIPSVQEVVVHELKEQLDPAADDPVAASGDAVVGEVDDCDDDFVSDSILNSVYDTTNDLLFLFFFFILCSTSDIITIISARIT